MFCQPFFSVPNEKCPGDVTISFTCGVTDPFGNGTTRWTVTTPDGESSVCIVSHDQSKTQRTCGPNDEIYSLHAGFNNGINRSRLIVPEDFNGTIVECSDQDLNTVGSADICIVGKIISLYYVDERIHAMYA